MAVLFMVGEGIEDETIIDRLLDIEEVQEKPNYIMASDKPLILSDCYFEGITFHDTLKGLSENFINSDALVEQAAIEL